MAPNGSQWLPPRELTPQPLPLELVRVLADAQTPRLEQYKSMHKTQHVKYNFTKLNGNPSGAMAFNGSYNITYFFSSVDNHVKEV